MSHDMAEQDQAEVRSTGPLLLILIALAAAIWLSSPTASGDEGRAAERPSAHVSTTR